jgi:hypothetical protein
MEELTLFPADPPGPAPSRPPAGSPDLATAPEPPDPPEPSGPTTVRLRFLVAYHGAGFHGFAPQPGGLRTVAGVLAAALEKVARQSPGLRLTGAGRTDAGVHARGQVVHVDLTVPEGSGDARSGAEVLDPVRLQRGLEHLGVLAGRPRGDGGVELVVAVEALGERAVGELGPLEALGQGPPGVVGLAGDGDPTVVAAGRVDPVRGHGQVAVAPRLPRPAVHLGVEQGGGLEVQGRFGLGQVEVLALAGEPAVLERGEHGRRAEAG